MLGLLLQQDSGASEEVNGILPSTVPDPAQIGLALLVLVLGWFVSKLAVQLLGRTVARKIERPSVTRTVLRGVKVSILAVTVAVAGTILGLSGGDILLQVTVLSAVIAVVLAPLVGSLINGFFVLADRPYEIGDMIEVTDEGHVGFVEDITIRYTKIFTLQNTFIVIPNSDIQQRDVINFSAEDERTRLSVEFEITYESDLEAARNAAERAARKTDTVIPGGPDIRIGSARYTAAPLCTVAEYAADGIRLELFFWVETPYKRNVVRSAVMTAVRERLIEQDVAFAYPRRHHVFDETSGVARVSGDNVGANRRPAGPTIDPNEDPSTGPDQ